MPENGDHARLLSQSAEAVRLSAGLARTYLNGIEDRNVAPTDAALAAMSAFVESLPDGPQPVSETLQKLDQFGSPATVASTAGRFFGLVVGGTLPAALGARVLASAWDQVVFNDAISPIGVKLEKIASDWLLDILGLPMSGFVGFTTGASMANFTCLAGARHALLERQGWDIAKQGMKNSPALRVVASEQIHVTVIKALTLLGVGVDQIEYVACDDQGRMKLASMPTLDASTIVLTQAGNVNSGACDPIGEIASLAKQCGAWVHVDGAFGLWAAASANTASLLPDYEAADSWVVDGHKWLNTPYDCGIAITRHPTAVHQAMATQAPYLKVGGAAAPKDMVPEFSRSARGVEIWAALHSLGRQGVAYLVDRCCAHAKTIAENLEGLGFEVLNNVVLNQVVATWKDNEALSSEIAQYVQSSGKAWFGPTNWQGRQAMRISVSSWATTEKDIAITTEAVKEALAALTPQAPKEKLIA